MANEVDICNVAVGYLGDTAQITSISPPDGSAQAALCARFYPLARDELLERHAWGFSTKRASLPLLAETVASTWLYAYALPADALNIISVLSPSALDDISVAAIGWNSSIIGPVNNVSAPVPASQALGVYTPQPFSVEIDASGAQVLLTNQSSAILRYTRFVTDTTIFSPLFTDALCCLLASKLAGPLLRGDTGIKTAMAWRKLAEDALGKASISDANQQRHTPQVQPSWMSGR